MTAFEAALAEDPVTLFYNPPANVPAVVRRFPPNADEKGCSP